MTEMTTIEKVRLSYQLADLLDNDDLKANFLTLKSGDRAYQLLTEAITTEVENLMNPDKHLNQDIAIASNEVNALVATVKTMVDNLSQLQNALVEMVQRTMSATHPNTVPPPAQKRVPRQRGMQLTAEQQSLLDAQEASAYTSPTTLSSEELGIF